MVTDMECSKEGGSDRMGVAVRQALVCQALVCQALVLQALVRRRVRGSFQAASSSQTSPPNRTAGSR
ncbi:hypothetical protein GCM10009738_01430 [Kitasatospora viridis]